MRRVRAMGAPDLRPLQQGPQQGGHPLRLPQLPPRWYTLSLLAMGLKDNLGLRSTIGSGNSIGNDLHEICILILFDL